MTSPIAPEIALGVAAIGYVIGLAADHDWTRGYALGIVVGVIAVA